MPEYPMTEGAVSRAKACIILLKCRGIGERNDHMWHAKRALKIAQRAHRLIMSTDWSPNPEEQAKGTEQAIAMVAQSKKELEMAQAGLLPEEEGHV